MRRAAWCGALLAGASALALACGSFGSDDSPGPGASDAAATESSTVDEGGTVDAGNTDASNVKFCASLMPKPIFCVDFDEGEAASTGFDEVIGTASVDSRFAFSAPSSLLMSTLDGGGNPDSVSRLGRTLSAATNAQRVSFMIRLGDDDGGALPASPYGIVFRLELADCVLDLDVGRGHLDVQHKPADGGAATDSRPPLVRRPAPGAWTKVELRLSDPAGAKGNVRAELDIGGQQAMNPVTTDCTGLGSKPRLFLGLTYSQNALVRYDDVVFDAN